MKLLILIAVAVMVYALAAHITFRIYERMGETFSKHGEEDILDARTGWSLAWPVMAIFGILCLVLVVFPRAVVVGVDKTAVWIVRKIGLLFQKIQHMRGQGPYRSPGRQRDE